MAQSLMAYISVLEDHAPDGDHKYGVNNNISAHPDLFAGIL